jgi:RNA polymerase sigma-70 factor (ECF subfamily)
MDRNDWFAKSFQENRSHMKAVAYRMLGNEGEADEAVQEAWLRLMEVDTGNISNLGGWLTTVVARVCLDMLRSRKSRRVIAQEQETGAIRDLRSSNDPESELLLADSVGPAMLVVLETLTPAERVAFVLHDLFDVSFEEIAPIVDRSAAATRQLASRARRKVQGADVVSASTLKSQREIVSAFLTASRDGNFSALLELLDPSVVLRADDVAVQTALKNKDRGAPPLQSEISGPQAVAKIFKGGAQAAQLALFNGVAGATWAPGGKPVVAFLFTLKNGKIATIDVVMERDRLKRMDIEIVNDTDRGN